MARHQTKRAPHRIPIDVMMIKPMKMSQSDSVSTAGAQARAVGAHRSLRGSSTITHHTSERRRSEHVDQCGFLWGSQTDF